MASQVKHGAQRMDASRGVGKSTHFEHKTLFNIDNTIFSLTSGGSCYSGGGVKTGQGAELPWPITLTTETGSHAQRALPYIARHICTNTTSVVGQSWELGQTPGQAPRGCLFLEGSAIPFPSHPLPPLRSSAPSIQLGGLGERCKLPSGV